MKTVCLLLKAPRSGTVKTRLARDIGPHQATMIYRALVEHQVRAIPEGWDVAVHFAPSDALMEMEAWLKPHFLACPQFVPQCDGALGDRLIHVVRTEFQRGMKRVFLIGGDCPGITRDYFAAADSNLDVSEVVVGPATDGGYVLLGLKAPYPVLFENIAWSTASVLDQTLAAARKVSLSVALLPVLEDIDDADALKRQSELGVISPMPHSAPRMGR